MRRTHSNLDRFEVIRLVPPAGVLIVWTVMMFDSGGFRPETWLPAGIVLEIRVTRAGSIGKFTRFRIRAGGSPPTRDDRCLMSGSRRAVSCPA